MGIVNWTNITDMSQLPGAANTASSGTFWGAMLHMIWVILMLMLIGWGWEASLMISSFLALILGMLLVYAGLVSWVVILEFAGIILFLFLYINWSQNK